VGRPARLRAGADRRDELARGDADALSAAPLAGTVNNSVAVCLRSSDDALIRRLAGYV
jgi:hypothetical protein